MRRLYSIIVANLSNVFPFGNMRYYSDWRDDDTQNAWIKLIRNAPSTLRWFRSDLTPDNTTTFRLEQPGVELQTFTVVRDGISFVRLERPRNLELLNMNFTHYY